MSLTKIIIYATDTGKEPFSEWEDGLDKKKRIQGGSGIWELRIDHGPGYRIYFGREGTTIVILLTGGSKKSQTRDIAKAKQYWLEYKELS